MSASGSANSRKPEPVQPDPEPEFSVRSKRLSSVRAMHLVKEWANGSTNSGAQELDLPAKSFDRSRPAVKRKRGIRLMLDFKSSG